MNRLVASEKEAVKQLCRRYRVRRLELFGSAVGAHFNEVYSERKEHVIRIVGARRATKAEQRRLEDYWRGRHE